VNLFWLILGCGLQTSNPPKEPPVVIDNIVDVLQENTPLGGPRYVVHFPKRNAQYVSVEALFPTSDQASIDLMLPTWTPGSYLLREYAQHVVDLRVDGDDGPLEALKISKNRWRVAPEGSERIRVRYDVWSTESTVRNNFVTQDMAILNGAPTFITDASALKLPHEVQIERPEGWSSIETGLPPHPNGRDGHYLATDADMLYDSPIFVGNPTTRSFEVEGVAYRIAMMPGGELWDHDRVREDLQNIVETQTAFWGSVPYTNYIFLNALVDARGGLEHSSSTLMMARQDQMLDEAAYKDWLGLVSHEFFHTWNVKRLRPVTLGPFDYEQEAYTRDLWIVEGITSYFDDLLLARGGLLTHDEYIGRLSDQIETLRSTPGRLHQSLADASFDAWIEHYRRDANSKNTAISYYTKGAVVAFALDATIRRKTGGSASLDDVMRAAYTRYSGEQGYTTAQWREVASEVAGEDLSQWFHDVVDTAGEVPLADAADWFGFQLSAKRPSEDPFVGWTLGGGQRVVRVLDEGPAWTHGVQLGDEILSIDGWRLPYNGFDGLKQQFAVGEEVEVLVARLGKVRTVPLTLGAVPRETTLATNPDASTSATSRRDAWLAERP
jgi:predicted metalloprotease with PDZ domain